MTECECYTEDYLKRYEDEEIEGLDVEDLINDLSNELDRNYRVSFVLIMYDHDTKTFGVDYNFRGSDEELFKLLGALGVVYRKLINYLEEEGW